MICSICISNLGRRKYITKCNHSFHTKCLMKWILTKDTCPMCREILRDIELEEYYVRDNICQYSTLIIIILLYLFIIVYVIVFNMKIKEHCFRYHHY